MYEPSVLKKSLQYSCDACGDLPILRRRWVCERCEDFDLCDVCHARQHKRPHSRIHGEDGSSDFSTSSDESAILQHDSTHEMRSYVVEDNLEPFRGETSGLRARRVFTVICRHPSVGEER